MPKLPAIRPREVIRLHGFIRDHTSPFHLLPSDFAPPTSGSQSQS